MMNAAEKDNLKIGSGTSCILVKDDSFCNGGDSRFCKWLENEGFIRYPYGGSISIGWVYINLTSKVYSGGRNGIKITSVIANHAITLEEFMTIYNIYKRYEGLGVLRMNWQEQYGHKYDGMKGTEFLLAFFRDHGITEEEIRLYSRWNDGFGASGKLAADHEGIKYAKKCVRKIVEYRKMSAEDVLENMDSTPWAWPSAKKFQNLLIPPRSEKEIWGIYQCVYNGRNYLFGIGKEEVAITEYMRERGKWFVYTWSD